MSEQQMLEGYLDGLDRDAPEPSRNRTESYRHGFANGRDDLRRCLRDIAANLRALAELAVAKDASLH